MMGSLDMWEVHRHHSSSGKGYIIRSAIIIIPPSNSVIVLVLLAGSGRLALMLLPGGVGYSIGIGCSMQHLKWCLLWIFGFDFVGSG